MADTSWIPVTCPHCDHESPVVDMIGTDFSPKFVNEEGDSLTFRVMVSTDHVVFVDTHPNDKTEFRKFFDPIYTIGRSNNVVNRPFLPLRIHEFIVEPNDPTMEHVSAHCVKCEGEMIEQAVAAWRGEESSTKSDEDEGFEQDPIAGSLEELQSSDFEEDASLSGLLSEVDDDEF